jgi:hypothetical protein
MKRIGLKVKKFLFKSFLFFLSAEVKMNGS